MSDNSAAESGETASTSLLEDTINVSFEDVRLEVRKGFLSKGRKIILNDVCGSFNAGELSVILGQSGAGKSSLMDILAGYTTPTTGRIYVNGHLRDDNFFRKRSCYIMQSDQLQDMLTVEESLRVAADLKLGGHVGKQLKDKRIEEIVGALGLDKSRKTTAINLSGGQKKRLAIGLELVNDPPVMFMDEPTSGLDSSMSKQMIFLLQLLARQGRTVIITMHQPSAVLLQMIDRLYAVVAGRCAYMGSVPSLIPYMAQDALRLKCLKFHNPVDFFIENCDEHSDALVVASQNGKNMDWTENAPSEDNNDLIGQFNLRTLYKQISITVLPPPRADETSKMLLSLKSTYSTSSWRQFCVLTKRSLLIFWRNPTFTRMLTGIHFLIALFIGVLYYNIGNDAYYTRDNYNFLYFSLMFLMFTAFSSVSINFPRELPVIRREHFNRWYTTGAYYSATVAAAIPTQTACALGYACITYYMTGQPPNPLRFFGYCWMLVLVSYVALCLGLLNGSLFDIKNAAVFGPFFIMPFTIFSGFFLSYKDAPYFFKWLFQLSFLKHGLVGIMLSIYGMDREKLPCDATFCYYGTPNFFLKDNGVVTTSFLYDYGFTVLALFVIASIVIISTYVILKIRLKSR